MAKQTFFVNPLGARRRKLVAFGFRNPRKKRRVRRVPSSRGLIPIYTVTSKEKARELNGTTNSFGQKVVAKRKPSGSYQIYVRRNPAKKRKGRVPEHLKKYLFKKRRSSTAHKGGSFMARKKKSNRRGSSHRRKHRKNPFQVALGANPRRRRSHRRNPARRRRHSFHRNPLSVSKLGLPSFKEMGWLTIGALAARIGVPRVIAALPILNKNGYTRALSRVGITAAASLVAHKVLKQNAKTFIYGVVANQFPEAVNDVASEMGVHLGLEDGENSLALYTNTQPAGLPMSVPSAGGMGVYTGFDGVGEYEVPLG